MYPDNLTSPYLVALPVLTGFTSLVSSALTLCFPGLNCAIFCHSVKGVNRCEAIHSLAVQGEVLLAG